MKIIDISERGIKILEDGEIINQSLFENEENIPQEIKELLSIYETSDVIILKIQIQLGEDIQNEIKNVIKKSGWKLKDSNKFNKKIKLIAIGIFLIELSFSGIIYSNKYRLNKVNQNLKNEISIYKKRISNMDKEFIFLEEDKEIKIDFKKSRVVKYLIFISEICKISDISLEKVEIKENKIFLTGFSDDIKKIFNLKKYSLENSQLLGSTFDYIKKEGEILYFLMELEIE